MILTHVNRATLKLCGLYCNSVFLEITLPSLGNSYGMSGVRQIKNCNALYRQRVFTLSFCYVLQNSSPNY